MKLSDPQCARTVLVQALIPTPVFFFYHADLIPVLPSPPRKTNRGRHFNPFSILHIGVNAPVPRWNTLSNTVQRHAPPGCCTATSALLIRGQRDTTQRTNTQRGNKQNGTRLISCACYLPRCLTPDNGREKCESGTRDYSPWAAGLFYLFLISIPHTWHTILPGRTRCYIAVCLSS